MKKIILTGALIIALSGGFVFAQIGSGGMMGSDNQGNMMMNRNMSRMNGTGMAGMMGNNIVATSDDGVVVMSFNKLYKFDRNLKLVKEADIPFDKEHAQKMMENLQSMGMMMRGMRGSMSSGSNN